MPSTYTIVPMRLHLGNCVSKELVRFPHFPGRSDKKTGFSHIFPLSKRSAYQDFQGFKKPSYLLPAMEANTYTEYVSHEIFSSVELDTSNSFYMVELKTSKEFGSCLRDLNAAILLSLIDAKGDSILQRISAVSWQLPGHENNAAETIHFQRGSVDIVTFKGPKLGKIESLWIGLESGSWRLDGIALTVINSPQSLSSSPEGMKEQTIDVMQYKFEANKVLLGEGEISVVELRPVLVTESPTATFSTLTNTNPCPSTSMKSGELMNEESMREYSDLKFSLLLYDFILFFTGSSILLTFSSDERYAYTFFVGGIGGFFYLLLLQRSVDGLSTDGELQNFAQGFGRFKGPLFGLALILAASIVAVKNEIGGSTMALTPAELFVGAAGFLTCKIAVVLAAFKPIKISLKEEE